MTQDRLLRVGIASTAGIARKTWAAICDSGRAIVTVVASRDVKKAEQFIAECQSLKPFHVVPKAMPATTEDKPNLYEPLYTSPDIDCIYIPIPMLVRYEVIFAALKAGKHVVTEKPVADSTEVVAEMIRLANENNVILCDGTMLTHGKRIQEVAAKIAASSPKNEIGQVSSISAVFTFPGDENFEKNDIRCDPKLENLGALGDIGHYCIQYAVEGLSRFLASASPSASIKSVLRPIRVKGEHVTLNDRGVNMTFEGSVEFEILGDNNKKVIHHFWCSFKEAHQMNISFRGSKGVLRVDDFCLPFVNEKSPEYLVETHKITNSDCRVDHVSNFKKYVVEGETSTFQEENKWTEVAFIMNYMNLRKDCFDEKIALELQQQALKKRQEFIDLIEITNKIMVGMFKAANANGWVNI